MRAMGRVVIAFVLVLLLAGIPAEAVINPVLGFVITAQKSLINGIPVAGGTNVTAGDVFATNANGGVTLRFGTNQVYIPGSSTVSFGRSNRQVLATVSNGSLEFTSPAGTGVAVSADGILVTPKDPQPTHAQITLLSNAEIEVASVTGALNLQLDGTNYTLTPGRTYGVTIVNAAPVTGQFTTGVTPRRRRNLIIVLFAATAAVAAAMYIHKELHESPAVP